MNYQKIVNEIINIENEEKLNEFLSKISNYLKSKNELINYLNEFKEENNNNLKNYIISNSEEIISIFILIKNLKDSLNYSKRFFEQSKNQILIIKKKYIEPYEKLNKSIINKKNIDETIFLCEISRNFKKDFNIIKNHFDKETLTISEKNLEIFLRLEKYSLNNLIGINFIKEEIEWYQKNKNNILEKFIIKLEKEIINKNNKEIKKYFEFFSNLNILVKIIKDFSNKILKNLMVEIFLNKIIRNFINKINTLDLFYENIIKIRKELTNFFNNLQNYKEILNNLNEILKNNFNKENLIIYENNMKIEDLNNINNLFIQKIFDSFKQIFTKIQNNNKFQNSYNYFTKDFLFFYFNLKKLKNDKKILDENLFCLKNDFINKFQNSIKDNFIRALNLIKNIEKKNENNINIHIITHLVEYIRKLSQSFIDCYEIFYNENENFYDKNDFILNELNLIFSNEIIANYFFYVFENIQISLNEFKNNNNKNNENIQKFYFNFYVLIKMKNVFISFLNSNINFLFNDGIIFTLEGKIKNFYCDFIKILEEKNDFNFIIENLNDFNNFIKYQKKLNFNLNLFLNYENYDKNKIFEKFIINISIYFYFISSVLLLFYDNNKINFEIFDNLFNEIGKNLIIFFKIKENKFLLKFHNEIKNICINNNNNNNENKIIIKLLLNFKQKIINNDYKNFINENKINIEIYIKYFVIILMKFFRFIYNFNDFINIKIEILNNIQNYLN